MTVISQALFDGASIRCESPSFGDEFASAVADILEHFAPSDGESFFTLLALMPSIDMIGIMPRGFFEHYGPREGLVKLPLDDVLPRITICAAWRADTQLTLPAQRMLDAFSDESAAYVRQPTRRSASPQFSASSPKSRSHQ